MSGVRVMQHFTVFGHSGAEICFNSYVQYKNTLPIVIVTFAIDCWGKTSVFHLLGFALKLDIGEVRTNRSCSSETVL